MKDPPAVEDLALHAINGISAVPPITVAVMDPLLALHVAVVDEAVIEGASIVNCNGC